MCRSVGTIATVKTASRSSRPTDQTSPIVTQTRRPITAQSCQTIPIQNCRQHRFGSSAWDWPLCRKSVGKAFLAQPPVGHPIPECMFWIAVSLCQLIFQGE